MAQPNRPHRRDALARDDQVVVERAVVLQFLAEPRWSRAGLEVALHDIPPSDIGDALAHLEAEGVVILDGEQVLVASPCARRLDALELIAI